MNDDNQPFESSGIVGTVFVTIRGRCAIPFRPSLRSTKHDRMKSRLLVTSLVVVCALLRAGASAQQEKGGNYARNKVRFEENGPKPGESAPDFELTTIDGQTVRASRLWAEKPTLIMTGSETCSVFRRESSPFEKLAADFRGRVNAVIIYTVEAHPENETGPYGKRQKRHRPDNQGGVVGQPKTAQQRVQRAKSCVKQLRLHTPVAADTMDNATWKTYGSAPNCAYLIGTDGRVVAQQGWFDPAEMRKAIETLLAKES
jgi:hypothetical protein